MCIKCIESKCHEIEMQLEAVEKGFPFIKKFIFKISSSFFIISMILGIIGKGVIGYLLLLISLISLLTYIFYDYKRDKFKSNIAILLDQLYKDKNSDENIKRLINNIKKTYY